MNADELITKLGRQNVMQAVGVSTAQVSNCLKVGKFPAHWFDAMDRLCEVEGIKLPRSIFAFKYQKDVVEKPALQSGEAAA